MPPPDQYDFLLKLLVIGAAGTGKSCLLHRFIDARFKEYSSHTIGVEFGSRVVSLGARSVKLQIWDTAGQERFRSVTRSYYRGAAGALLVFDITNRESFTAASAWLQDARQLACPSIVVVLVGHKSDLNSERQVPREEAEQYAKENGLMFIEASAKDGTNAGEAFLECARSIIMRIETGEIDPSRPNSGIQYGNMVTRNLGSTAGDNGDCSC